MQLLGEVTDSSGETFCMGCGVPTKDLWDQGKGHGVLNSKENRYISLCSNEVFSKDDSSEFDRQYENRHDNEMNDKVIRNRNMTEVGASSLPVPAFSFQPVNTTNYNNGSQSNGITDRNKISDTSTTATNKLSSHNKYLIDADEHTSQTFLQPNHEQSRDTSRDAPNSLRPHKKVGLMIGLTDTHTEHKRIIMHINIYIRRSEHTHIHKNDTNFQTIS
jgi:hypothetical protein